MSDSTEETARRLREKRRKRMMRTTMMGAAIGFLIGLSYALFDMQVNDYFVPVVHGAQVLSFLIPGAVIGFGVGKFSDLQDWHPDWPAGPEMLPEPPSMHPERLELWRATTDGPSAMFRGLASDVHFGTYALGPSDGGLDPDTGEYAEFGSGEMRTWLETCPNVVR